MNASSTKHLIIGLVVIIGFATLAFTALKFMQKNQSTEQKIYLIYLQETAGGLSPGSPVKFKGITIGQVDQIQIAQEDNTQIKVTVKIVNTFVVKEGMVATLEVAGITGESLIAIRSHTSSSKDLAPRKGQPYPVIPSESSSLQKLFHAAPELLTDTQMLVTRLSSFLDEKTQKNFHHLIENMRAFSDVLDQNKHQFGQVFENTNRTLGTLEQTSHKLDKMLDHGFIDLSQSLIQLTQTLSTLDSFIESLNQRVNQLVPDQRGTYELQS